MPALVTSLTITMLSLLVKINRFDNRLTNEIKVLIKMIVNYSPSHPFVSVTLQNIMNTGFPSSGSLWQCLSWAALQWKIVFCTREEQKLEPCLLTWAKTTDLTLLLIYSWYWGNVLAFCILVTEFVFHFSLHSLARNKFLSILDRQTWLMNNDRIQ